MEENKFIEIQQQMRQNQTELQDYLKDLDSWETSIKQKEKLQSSNRDSASQKSVPPVRNSLNKKVLKRKSKVNGDSNKIDKKTEKKQQAQRISSYDYRAWDKFDVDAALESDGEGKKETSTSEYETDEEEEIRLKKQKANWEKDKGNQLFKEGQFVEAIECYTSGIELDPDNAIILANRAMALIKQERHAAAEVDCTQAISVDPGYVKSYFRRATARASLNKLDLAIEDYDTVLKLEPQNKLATKERERVISLKNPKALETESALECEEGIVKAIYKPPELRSKKPMRRMKIEEVGRSKISEVKGIQRVNVNTSTYKHHSQPQRKTSTSNSLTSCVETSDGKTTHNVSSSPRSNTTISSAEISHPTNDNDRLSTTVPGVPKTSYQFQADWKLVKKEDTLFYKYFKQIDPKDYFKLFGEAMDSEIFSKVLKILKDYFIRNEEDVLPTLINLAQVKRFKMTLMFMSSNDKKDLLEILDYVKQSEKWKHTAEESMNLQKLYGL